MSVSQDEPAHVEARLKVFYEEELNVELWSSTRCSSTSSGSTASSGSSATCSSSASRRGKTVLTRFVAWMNGLSVFQVKVTRRYSIEDFEEDLRGAQAPGLRRREDLFIFDESNILPRPSSRP